MDTGICSCIQTNPYFRTYEDCASAAIGWMIVRIRAAVGEAA